ncbi:MAG TPA: ABC transporter ATP-binding protein [Ktedonobacterales bacterium]
MVSETVLRSNATSSETAPALALERVSFGYGAERGRSPNAPTLLHDLSLRVLPGEMVALLGPNGAGKTTVLKLASGVLAPRSGTIRLNGEPLARIGRAEIARRVAVVPQGFSVQFAYTVRQVVELGRTPHRGFLGLSGTGDQEAVERALAETRTAALADRVFNELSGGERQRVILALALAQEAGLVLLDEPTAHLDIRHQVEALELLRRLNRERGLTVVAALHDLNLAARYFPRLVLFARGIVADGPPAAVLDAALLSRVYETPVRVGILPGEVHLSVLPPGHRGVPVSGGEPDADTSGGVHVIAGGGSGALLLRALADAGIRFSVGPLNAGDSDLTLARQLGAATHEEPPFAPISPEGLRWARERIASARAVIVAPVPLGPGNVALLDLALDAACECRPALLLEPELPDADGAPDTTAERLAPLVRARDYSGRGEALYRALLAAGARCAATPAAVVAQVAEIATTGT